MSRLCCGVMPRCLRCKRWDPRSVNAETYLGERNSWSLDGLEYLSDGRLPSRGWQPQAQLHRLRLRR